MHFALLLALAFLPPSKPYTSLGCTIDAIQDDFHVKWVHTHVWVRYGTEEWKRLYSIREGDDPRKSMKECDVWIKQAKKILPPTRKK